MVHTTVRYVTLSLTSALAAFALLACGEPVGDDSECVVTGCSSHVCAEEHVATTCEWREEYACYREATCERQPSGACGWTETEELRECLASSSSGNPEIR